MSTVRRAGPFLVASGQTGHKDWVFPPDVAGQTHLALENLSTAIAEEGLKISDVIKVNLYVTSMSDFGEVNRIYSAFMPRPYPARTTVGVNELPLGARVEIEAWAYFSGEAT